MEGAQNATEPAPKFEAEHDAVIERKPFFDSTHPSQGGGIGGRRREKSACEHDDVFFALLQFNFVLPTQFIELLQCKSFSFHKSINASERLRSFASEVLVRFVCFVCFVFVILHEESGDEANDGFFDPGVSFEIDECGEQSIDKCDEGIAQCFASHPTPDERTQRKGEYEQDGAKENDDDGGESDGCEKLTEDESGIQFDLFLSQLNVAFDFVAERGNDFNVFVVGEHL